LNGQHAVNELSDAPQLCPACIGSGIDKDHPDYTIHCAAWDSRPPLRDRSMTVNGPMTRLNALAAQQKAHGQQHA
jgi:hypothetical protein